MLGGASDIFWPIPLAVQCFNRMTVPGPAALTGTGLAICQLRVWGGKFGHTGGRSTMEIYWLSKGRGRVGRKKSHYS